MEPLIVWCYLGGAESGWREKGMTAFLIRSPCGRFGTVMRGLGGVWVGVWCCYLPPCVYQPLTPPFHTHTCWKFFCLLCNGWSHPGRSPEEGVSRLLVPFTVCVFILCGFAMLVIPKNTKRGNFRFTMSFYKTFFFFCKLNSAHMT